MVSHDKFSLYIYRGFYGTMVVILEILRGKLIELACEYIEP